MSRLAKGMIMRTLIVALALAAGVAAQAPANFSGKWIIQGGGRGGGRGGGPTLTLNQTGAEVTGELVGGGGGGGGSTAPINNEIYDGKASGNTLTFYVWRGTDKPYRTTYTGTMNAAGDEIAFTITGVLARGGGAGQAPGRGGQAAGAAPAPTIARRAK